MGHVLLERRQALAHELELKDDVSALRICVAAYLRWGQHCASRLSGEFSFAWALITDDVMHLRPDGVEWVAEHYRTGTRLWPDAVAFLLGEHARLPRVTPTWDKHVLQVSVTGRPAAARGSGRLHRVSRRQGRRPRGTPIGCGGSG